MLVGLLLHGLFLPGRTRSLHILTELRRLHEDPLTLCHRLPRHRPGNSIVADHLLEPHKTLHYRLGVLDLFKSHAAHSAHIRLNPLLLELGNRNLTQVDRQIALYHLKILNVSLQLDDIGFLLDGRV